MAERIRSASPASLLFAAALALSGGLLLHFLSELTFWRDEWAFILDRRGGGIDVYLDPFVEQLLAIPIAIYKVLIASFGIESAAPFQLVSTATFLLSVALVFVYARRRVGEWIALAAVLPILFLGPSWDDLLFPFQISFFGSVSCGVGALLALDRRDRRGDLLATGLLLAGLLFSHVGIPFVIAATVDVGLGRDRFRRAFIVAVPTAIWFLWYLGWGREADHFVSLHNAATLFSYVADGFGSSLSTLVGLAVPRDEVAVDSYDWGRPLLVIALVLAIWRGYRVGIRALPTRLWAVVAMGISFWTLTGLNASFFGQASSGRYQYLGAIFIVLIAAELLRGAPVRRWVLIFAFAVAGAATLANFSYLRLSAFGLDGISERQQAGLAALELTHAQVRPDFVLTEENSGVDYLGIVDAASYFSAIDAYGSPAYTEAELATASEDARSSADRVFAAALELAAVPGVGADRGECSTLRATAGAPAVVELDPGGAVISSRSRAAELRLRRYAESFPVDLGSLEAGATATVAIPGDGSPRPWHLSVSGPASVVSICRETA